MKKNNINFKKICMFISDYSIISFGTLIISKYFVDLGFWNSSEFTNTLVIIYLISSLFFYKAEIKDQKRKISFLESELAKKAKK